ncbi:hypothetical protein PanWU01x14_215310 [Parasponia andersonii]|uniref:Uncharacterized protein n=1 Tax=Parasponia andersonii TaxID=3476 RepID=A0A2P5BS80_PARAD|nr:hypothetical protein PanWU01x14_215310 [Parasponia andersonii]
MNMVLGLGNGTTTDCISCHDKSHPIERLDAEVVKSYGVEKLVSRLSPLQMKREIMTRPIRAIGWEGDHQMTWTEWTHESS